jgi:hypothetical protein
VKHRLLGISSVALPSRDFASVLDCYNGPWGPSFRYVAIGHSPSRRPNKNFQPVASSFFRLIFFGLKTLFVTSQLFRKRQTFPAVKLSKIFNAVSQCEDGRGESNPEKAG